MATDQTLEQCIIHLTKDDLGKLTRPINGSGGFESLLKHIGQQVKRNRLVLTHELAHAYSHLGKDIDGDRWDTIAFARTDLQIVEGLAQFYTKAICQKVYHRFPGAMEAYERMLACQSLPYRVHADWIADDNQKGEIIRYGMINVGRQQLTAYDVFVEGL